MLIVMVVENNQVSTHMYVCVCTLLVDKHTQQQTKRVCGFFCTMIKTKQIFFFSSRMFRARRKRIAKLTFLVLSFAFFYTMPTYTITCIYTVSRRSCHRLPSIAIRPCCAFFHNVSIESEEKKQCREREGERKKTHDATVLCSYVQYTIV